MFELETVPHSWTPQAQMGLRMPRTTTTYFRSIVAICCRAANTFCSIEGFGLRVTLNINFIHPIGVSLAESFNLVSNVWHVEIMM